MKRILFVIAIVLSFAACTGDEGRIKEILKADGCTQIELTGYDAFGCSDSDTFSCGFTAVKNGINVKGVVCSGVWKGSTIRYY